MISAGLRYQIVRTENTIFPESWDIRGYPTVESCREGTQSLTVVCGGYSVRGKISVPPHPGHTGKIIAGRSKALTYTRTEECRPGMTEARFRDVNVTYRPLQDLISSQGNNQPLIPKWES
jgi:hypothetical protein